MATAIKNYSIPIPPVASQFLYAPKASTPERRLLAAVLEDAMRIIQCGPEYHESPWEPNAYRETIDWVAADRDPWPFCFVALCEALGLDACSVRTRLLRVGVGRARRARHR